jgi:hypothetical protein
MATYYSDKQVNDFIKDTYGDIKNLTETQKAAVVADAANYGVSFEQLARVADVEPQAVVDYAATQNQQLVNESQAMQAAIDRAYAQQYGRAPTETDIAEGIKYLQGGGESAAGMGLLNVNTEGYNYDVQDIVAAYRQAGLGNPTQEQFVQAMANLGLGNFDRSTLAGQQAAEAAYVNAVEADPYAGRYANVNPYQTTADGVNVSQNVMGNYVQYTSPITQRPVVVTVGADGQLIYSEGQDVLTGEQAANAIGMALNTGAMTQGEYNALMQELQGLGTDASMQDVYDVFAKPQAVAALDPNYGFQLGAGKTLAEARQNSEGIQALVDQIAAQNGGYMPSNMAVSNLATEQGVPFQFGQEVYNQQYQNPTYATQATTPQQVIQSAPQINEMLFGRENQLATLLPATYYSERGLESQFSPIGQGPTFRSGVAGYTQNLPTGFNFGVTPVLAQNPVFTPGTFNPNATGYDQAGNPIFGDTAQYTPGTDSYLNNPIIGYTPEGTPIYGANAPVVDSGGD